LPLAGQFGQRRADEDADPLIGGPDHDLPARDRVLAPARRTSDPARPGGTRPAGCE
jgi:hypothetical protein